MHLLSIEKYMDKRIHCNALKVVSPFCRHTNQWRNEPKHLGGGGTIFARERSDRVGGGCVPPPTVGSFFIFRLENVQSGAYLRRKL